ncbi:MAG: methyltransferase domain-containing protein [Immundisolibacteraceae bacterium]|nr:methyltransferase domain-containing protein [Immundisolibacteraceae bacterium]
MDNFAISWSELYGARKQIQQRFKKIWNLPIAKRYSTVLHQYGHDHATVLEIGAGDRGLYRRLKDWWPSTEYKSYDIDPNTEHDFHDLNEITGSYDIICMFEVIEHVSPETATAILKKCYQVMSPGGLLFITTPNTFYPPNYLRDATHITPWCYDELGSIALMAGFSVTSLYRLYTDSLIGKITHKLIFYPVHRALGIDFSKQIILVAHKPEVTNL